MADETYTEPEDEGEEPVTAPTNKLRSAKPYLDMIKDAEKCFKTYQDKCDNIEKVYADLDRLSKVDGDREFQMFWANLEVVKPSIYSRPPVPVVVPRFKDRKPLPREASSLLERCSITNFEQEDIDTTMRLIRDDLATNARGAAWCWYEVVDEKQLARIAHVDRKDFLHDPARYWHEVEWVARGSWLTKKQARKRFAKYSGKLYATAEYNKRKDADGDTEYQSKARFWEVWHKTEKRICWVSPGLEQVLDEAAPDEMMTLDGFFPCPRPAYGTIQRRTLKPVPDMLFYKDQLEEINELTARISALAEGLKLRGFYAGGAEEMADAIEAAVKSVEQNAILIPVANWAAMGGTGKIADAIAWLPVDMVAKTIVELVTLRRQIIDDVYQITGLSDIMRGSTDPNETLGAQELKSQYGSIRIRDRQAELVRIARDITRIQCEIMAENFSPETLAAMSQTDLPRVAQLQEQATAIHQQMQQVQMQVQQAQQSPEIAAMAQQQPEQAQQMAQQAEQQIAQMQGQIEKLQNEVTLEAVVALLREQRMRPFILDIETDSTIQPDEDAAKQRMTEFITAIGGFVGQSFPMVQQQPKLAPFVGEMLKQASSVFRAGRDLEGTIDELVEQMKELGNQPQADPAAQAAEAEAKAKQAESAAKQQEANTRAQQAADQHTATMAQIDAKSAADAKKAEDEAILGQQKIKLGELSIELAQVKLAEAKAPKPEPKSNGATA